MINIKPYRQLPAFCGPAALKMVLAYYGVSVSEKELIKKSGATNEKGVSYEGLAKAARFYGFKVFCKEKSAISDLKYYITRKIPVIVDWFSHDDGHYSVVIGVEKNKIILIDPEVGGLVKMDLEKFYKVWFDFPGDYIKSAKDIILRLMLVVTPPFSF